MEWSLVLADLSPRVRQEVEAMRETIAFLQEQITRLERQRDLAEETLTRVETERLAATRERDVLRQALDNLAEMAAADRAELARFRLIARTGKDSPGR